MIRRLQGGTAAHQAIALSVGGRLVTNAKEIAETFADHFAAVSSDANYAEPFAPFKEPMEMLASPAINQQITLNIHPELNVEFTLAELERALMKCKPTSAPGHDGITYQVLAKLPHSAKLKLLDLYNRAWTEQKLPEDWRRAVVVPYLKVGKDPHFLHHTAP